MRRPRRRGGDAEEIPRESGTASAVWGCFGCCDAGRAWLRLAELKSSAASPLAICRRCRPRFATNFSGGGRSDTEDGEVCRRTTRSSSCDSFPPVALSCGCPRRSREIRWARADRSCGFEMRSPNMMQSVFTGSSKSPLTAEVRLPERGRQRELHAAYAGGAVDFLHQREDLSVLRKDAFH